MKRKIGLTFITFFLIVLMVLSNVSYASNVTTSSMQKSLQKYFGQKIIIKETDGSETTMEVIENKINSSSITILNEGKEYNTAKYSVANNVATINLDFTNLKKENATEEEQLEAAIMSILLFGDLTTRFYLASADAVGQDVSLAYMYLNQQISKYENPNPESLTVNITDDVFSFSLTSGEDLLEKASLKVNLDKLAKLNKSKIDSTTMPVTLYLGKVPEPTNISKTTISSIVNQIYTGKAIKPSLTVKFGNILLKNGTDYTVAYKNNTNIGKATATITGKGNYTGTKTVSFNIIVAQVKNLKVKAQTNSSITLNWSKNSGSVTGYQVYMYNTKTKKYVLKGTTTGTSYTVKKLSAGTTYQFKVRAYKTISKKNNYGSYSSVLKTTTKTKTPTIKKLTSKAKKATIKWGKISGATGYEIYMATSKKGKYTNIKTITKGSTVSFTKTKLTKKKTYYFKIRTYRTVEGKKVYSSYSAIKKVKIK